MGRALLAAPAVHGIGRAPGDQVGHHLALAGDDHHQHVGGHDGSDQRPDLHEGAPRAEYLGEGEGQGDDKDEADGGQHGVVAAERGAAQPVVNGPAERDRGEADSDAGGRLDGQHGRIDEIQAGAGVVDGDDQREARDPGSVGLPLEPGELSLAATGFASTTPLSWVNSVTLVIAGCCAWADGAATRLATRALKAKMPAAVRDLAELGETNSGERLGHLSLHALVSARAEISSYVGLVSFPRNRRRRNAAVSDARGDEGAGAIAVTRPAYTGSDPSRRPIEHRDRGGEGSDPGSDPVRGERRPRRCHSASRSQSAQATTTVARFRSSSTRFSSARLALASRMVRGPAP